MKIYATLLLVLLLAISSGAMADSSEPPTGTAGLICKAASRGQLYTQTIVLDYTQKLVNGIPATYTDAMIVWIETVGDKVEHHELNRIRGTYNTWIEHETPGEPLLTYSCEKAPMKF